MFWWYNERANKLIPPDEIKGFIISAQPKPKVG
jgi:hypothetical protein